MIDTTDTPVVIGEILAGDGRYLYEITAILRPHRITRDSNGKPRESKVATTTLWRWHHKGAKSPDGRRVYLEMARIGGKWMTSAAALARFFAALTPPTHGATEPTPVPGPRSERQQTRAAERAAKELERLGA